ncbi:hypothetical protein BO71DRAFT_321229 [Aspergillus ellipticus CBS 707.79]|uniref:RraA-like protein n=1 Tax=Aspergillus ellipticus CBS 707.79 TaxID=1448320 RepID=A0A319DG22_9EURO|nr:hypothetical protein BO71DRAFT_321229 [Aspergillus ellipticus CBS 707.79]
MPTTLEEKLAILQNYSACDVSDALLKLQPQTPGTPARAGYLADLTLHPSPSPINHPKIKTIAPASTIKFLPKNAPDPPLPLPTQTHHPTLIPKSTPWADLTPAHTIMVLEQPPHQHCAVVGGINALRMKQLGARGVVVGGRVRDMAEIGASGLGVWARGGSTIGSGAEARAGVWGGG